MQREKKNPLKGIESEIWRNISGPEGQFNLWFFFIFNDIYTLLFRFWFSTDEERGYD